MVQLQGRWIATGVEALGEAWASSGASELCHNMIQAVVQQWLDQCPVELPPMVRRLIEDLLGKND